MTKKFSVLQLFSLTDGRMSTKIGDVYDMLNHICDAELFTHNLPGAFSYLKLKNPKWFQQEKDRIDRIKAGLVSNTFETVIGAIKDKHNEQIDVPQLKDEFNTSDFMQHMVDNSPF